MSALLAPGSAVLAPAPILPPVSAVASSSSAQVVVSSPAPAAAPAPVTPAASVPACAAASTPAVAVGPSYPPPATSAGLGQAGAVVVPPAPTVIVTIGLNVPKTKDREHRRISAQRLQTLIAFCSQLQMT
ncbi:unnamed protein product [Closterium sp. NIES-54]